MSFNESTQTMTVGSQDWLTASENLHIRSYLPSPGYAVTVAGPLTWDTERTATTHQAPATTDEEHGSARLAERLSEAYRGDELEPEEREFLNRAAEQFGSRLSGQE